MFKNSVLEKSPDLGAGEIIKSKPYITEAFEGFADGVLGGRFVQAVEVDESIQIQSLDGTADALIAGIASRKISGAIEETDTYTAELDGVCEVHIYGFATVEVDEAAAPKKYGQVYAINESGDNAGLATDADTGLLVSDCVFWEAKAAGVWLVALTKIITPAVAADTGA